MVIGSAEVSGNDFVFAEDFESFVEWQFLNEEAAAAGNGGGLEQGVEDGFFGGLDDRLEERGHGVVAELSELPGLIRIAGMDAQLMSGGEGDDEIAAAVGGGRARAGHARDGASSETLEIARTQGSIGRDDDHAGTVGVVAQFGEGGLARGTRSAERSGRSHRRDLVVQIIAAQLDANGSAGDGENAAKIGLHENAYGVTAERCGKPARGGTDAALKAERNGAGACADRAFLNQSGLRGGNGVEDMFAVDGTRTNVAKVAVVGFADQRIDGRDVFIAGKRKHVVDEEVSHAGNAERASQENRRFDFAEFVDLRGTGQLAEGVADEHGAGHFFAKEITGVGKDGGDTGANGVGFEHRGVANEDAGDVGNGVERAGRENADADAYVAGARASWVLCGECVDPQDQDRDGENEGTRWIHVNTPYEIVEGAMSKAKSRSPPRRAGLTPQKATG
jgi:hypothetical protein